MKKLIGIGVGPGDPELITVKAVNAIQNCAYVFVPKNKGDSLAGNIAAPYLKDKPLLELAFPMGEDNAQRYIQAAKTINETLNSEETGVFLTLGDPLTYSTFAYLRQEVIGLGIEVSVIPGITSYHAAAAVLGEAITLRDEAFYLADGNVEEEVLTFVDSVCILKPLKNMETLLDRLEKHDFHYVYVKRCGQKGETILKERNLILQETDYLSLILAKRN
ncbi:precorrin-2 C(20)-methyltransferase [Deltaproteobacteria bacterium TL4]